jgi:hypothetical protein
MNALNEIQFLNSTQRFLNVKKNAKIKPQGVEKVGLKPTLNEPPNKFKVSSLELKVLLKRKKPHNTHIHLFLCHFHSNILSQKKYIIVIKERYCCYSP